MNSAAAKLIMPPDESSSHRHGSTALQVSSGMAGALILMRTRYETFTGEFVLHCHILDHEDQGMMQNVAIVPRGVGTGMAHR